MRRHGVLVSIVAAAGLLAAACGAEGGDGQLRALPRASGGAAAAESGAAVSRLADDAAVGASWYRPRVYEAGERLGAGLPDEAPAYELKGTPTEDDVRRLAGVLGMSSEADVEAPDGDDMYYRVEDGDLVLQVQRTAGGPWQAFDERDIAGVATSCTVAVSPEGRSDIEARTEADASSEPSASGAGGGAASAPVSEELRCEEHLTPAEDSLSPDEAEASARRILDALSSDGVTYSLEADGPSGGPSAGVNVSVAVDGRPVPSLGSWFSFGPEGEVLMAQGWLGTFHSIGDYPLVNPATAVDRLNEQPDATIGLGRPEPAIEPAPGVDCPPEADCIVPEPGPTESPGPEPRPDAQPEPEPEVVVLEQARIGYQVAHGGCDDDPVLLVPAYLFEVPDGHIEELSVEAVTDEFLLDDGGDHRIVCGEPGVDSVPGRDPGAGDGGGGGVSPGYPGPDHTGSGEVVPVEPQPAESTESGEAESKVATTTQ